MNPLLSRLSFRTAGESHGPAVVSLLEGLPRGLAVDLDAVNAALRRRQGGAGRGGRQRIEQDAVEVLGGLRRGVTIGSPLCMVVRNRDHTIDELPEPSRPRPGHADLAGCYRWLDTDIRSTLERASARETAGRVAAGAVCAQVLRLVGAEVLGFVRQVGRAELPPHLPHIPADPAAVVALRAQRDGAALYTLDPVADAAMVAEVEAAARSQDTVGGVVEVRVHGLPPGLGSCLQWHERLDSRLGAALLSIPAIKGVEVGVGFGAAEAFGSSVHDPIVPQDGGTAPGGVDWLATSRTSNRAGGLEGGMTNGQPLVVRAAMKPISTLLQPLASVDLASGAAVSAGYERSDVCAVAAASVVAEGMVALVLADALLARIGGETVAEFLDRWRAFSAAAAALGRAQPKKGPGHP